MLYEDPALPYGKGHSRQHHFSASISCGQTVAHLSNSWALVFNMAAVRHLGILKTGICNCVHGSESVRVIIQNVVDRSKRCWYMVISDFFSKWRGRPASWICFVSTTHDK